MPGSKAEVFVLAYYTSRKIFMEELPLKLICFRICKSSNKLKTTAEAVSLPAKPAQKSYLTFFLWRFLRKRFFRLCVAILCLFLFLPDGMIKNFLFGLYINQFEQRNQDP